MKSGEALGDMSHEASLKNPSLVERLGKIPPQQWIKIAVYSLLLINFVQYAYLDFVRMTHTWHDAWTWFDWTSAFATTLDESAWFLLLMLLELETYLLSDEAFTRSRVAVMHGLRVVCVLVIGHTVIAFGDYLLKLNVAVEHVETPLCAFAEDGVSFTRNLEYWDVDATSCQSLSNATTLYQFDEGQLISDAPGLVTEWGLAWADFVEVVVWLFILIMIEVMVRLQDKGVTRGATLTFAKYFNGTLYLVLWSIAAYWAYLGHWVYAWDEALWILGFMAIGMNLSEWRDEIDSEREQGAIQS